MFDKEIVKQLCCNAINGNGQYRHALPARKLKSLDEWTVLGRPILLEFAAWADNKLLVMSDLGYGKVFVFEYDEASYNAAGNPKLLGVSNIGVWAEREYAVVFEAYDTQPVRVYKLIEKAEK